MDENKQEKSSVASFAQVMTYIFGVFFVIGFVLKKLAQDKEESKVVVPEEKKKVVVKEEKPLKNLHINDRQSRILESIRSKKVLEPKDIYNLIPDVSTRTLRRDMDVLVARGVVKQQGSTKNTKYTYIG